MTIEILMNGTDGFPGFPKILEIINEFALEPVTEENVKIAMDKEINGQGN